MRGVKWQQIKAPSGSVSTHGKRRRRAQQTYVEGSDGRRRDLKTRERERESE